jgi:hypothetical protein
MKDNIILSICIPTRERPIILKNTLDSIYNSFSSLDKFEVVIYDSSEKMDTKVLIENYKYENLNYVYGPNKNGLNLIEALKLGKGDFLKLHNDYSEFKIGSLNSLINCIEKNSKDKPVLFFTNREIESIDDGEFEDFNSFLTKINYWCTWSTLFGVWKSDFDLMNKDSLNDMFPHTELLLDMTNKEKYIIINECFFINNTVKNKGGYDLFYTFSVVFLNLLSEKVKKKVITIQTFNILKYKLLKEFLVNWYCGIVIFPNKYTFIKVNIKKSILTNYSYYDYLNLLFLSYLKALFLIIKKIRSFILNFKKKYKNYLR